MDSDSSGDRACFVHKNSFIFGKHNLHRRIRGDRLCFLRL